jgi:hypothetical protein
MTTVVKSTTTAPSYVVTDAHDNVRPTTQGQATFVGGAPTITLGDMVLTQQNVTDLLPVLTRFSANGVLT